jgi:putative peptide zinc metalloprotease protein
MQQAVETGPYCLYPPRIAHHIDVTEQNEGGTVRYVVRNRANSRYFLLRPTEYQVFKRIDGSRSLAQIAAPEDGAGPRASRQAVVKFLCKLDGLGLVERGGALGVARADRGLYPRFSLFNPDPFLGWLDQRTGWLLARPFIAASFVMMAVAALGILIRGTEAAAYTSYTYSTYGLAAILLFTLVITTLHEFAHGLACKHFGGEVPEVGVLLIFYVLPALYCNVSDVYRFGRKRERVWVIAAGIYWQLLVAAMGALVWLAATPQTALADFAFLTLLGATFNILINCNPLIKLDGYYALSQMLGIQNLQSRSSAYVGSVIARVIDGAAAAGAERTGEASATQPRMLYFIYWLLSITYSAALIWLVVVKLGDTLMNWLGFIGILMTLALVIIVGQRFLRPIFRGVWGGLRVWGVQGDSGGEAVFSGLKLGAAGAESGAGTEARPYRVFDLFHRAGGGAAVFSRLRLRRGRAESGAGTEARPNRVFNLFHRTGGRDAASFWVRRASSIGVGGPSSFEGAEMQNIEAERVVSKPRARYSRRTMVKAGVAVLIIAAIVAPWESSAGSDCALLLPPGHEAPVRAGVDATLAEVFVVPGDAVAEGTRIARLANPELEDRLTQLNGDITRLDTRDSEIEETLRVRSEELLSANFKEQDRARLAAELKDEAAQIERARTPDAAGSRANAAGSTGGLPASLAVLQSDIELKQTQLDYNRNEVERYRKLYEQGLVGAIQYDAAVNSVRLGEKELEQARARLAAALVDHHRLVDSTETGQLVAQTEARAARSNFQALITELHSNREQLQSLRERRQILQREYDSMNVLAPKSGIVLGEDLRKSIGGHLSRGQEICRIGELERFLLQIDVNERDIADVKLDSPVRFKLKTVPGRTFNGRVSKIRAESSNNQYGQRVYPVEVAVENSDGMLRPGMTGFARISFGRQSIGLIAAQKVWQALRPEMWLF